MMKIVHPINTIYVKKSSHKTGLLFFFWQRSTLPGSCPPSTLDAGGLYFCVRYGNRCGPSAIITGSSGCTLKIAYSFLTFHCFLEVWSSPRPISTCQLNALLHLHLRPITTLSTWGLTPFLDGKSHLEGGFALRCLQRLSLPNLATQLCHWHDN